MADTVDDFVAAPGNEPEASQPLGHDGRRVGAWRLVGLIGAGPVAEVYRAVRAEGDDLAPAALKLLLRRHIASEPARQLFAADQRALSRLDHPNIPRWLDAGSDADGRPYRVEELVDGRPIDQACAELDQEDRLRLFLHAADALAHAHRHLLLHGALTPGVLRVSAAPPEEVHLGRGKLWGPGAPAPTALGTLKLLGLGCRESRFALDGQAAAFHGASAYASPEQRRGEPLTIASDIYSLGAVLYTVVMGALPTTVTPDDPAWPAIRDTLPGDLEPVLRQAMQPSPGQRYGSVDAFAADVRRHLAGQPVSACVPSIAYRARRFAGRYRDGLGLAGGAAVLSLLALVTAVWQAERATLARRQAETRLEAIRSVTHDVVLRYGDAVNYLPGSLAAKEILLKDVLARLDQLGSEAGDDPDWLASLASVHARLAQVQANETGISLDRMADARRNAERAIELGDRAWVARQHDPRFVAAYVLALQVRAQAERAAGRYQDGARDLDEAMRRIETALSAAAEVDRRPLRQQRAASQLLQAQWLYQPANGAIATPERAFSAYDKAESELLALDAQRAELPVTGLLGSLYNARAMMNAQLDRLDAARRDAEAAVQWRQRALREEPFNPAWRDALVAAATNHAIILLRLDQPAPALVSSELAWSQVQGLARESGPQGAWITVLARTAQHHGRALVANGRFQEALPVLARARSLWEATLAREPGADARRMLAWATLYQARAQHGLGDDASARAQAQSAIAELALLAAEPTARDAKLNLGEACLFMASLETRRQAPASLKCAREAYAEANALRPLSGDALRAYRSAGG